MRIAVEAKHQANVNWNHVEATRSGLDTAMATTAFQAAFADPESPIWWG